MEGKDNRRQEEHQHNRLSGAGDESPVLAIAQLSETPSLEHNRDQEYVAQTASANTEEANVVCDDDDDGDFEFAFASSESDLPAIRPADEIFSEGRIRPIYPIFDRGLFQYYHSIAKQATAAERPAPVQRLPLRDLMKQQRQNSLSRIESKTRSSVDSGSSPVALARTGSCSSSDGDELVGVPEETYCLWTPGSVPPSPDNLGRKSRSTGSSGSRRWRLRDLVLGRSHSDGRQKLMFFQHDDAEPSRSSSVAATAGSSTSRREDLMEGEKKGKKATKDASEEKKKGKNDKKPPTTKKKSVATELDMATAHRLFYRNNSLNNGAVSAAEAQGQRRSSSPFLPHRKDLFVGIFPHARRDGLRSSSFYGF